MDGRVCASAHAFTRAILRTQGRSSARLRKSVCAHSIAVRVVFDVCARVRTECACECVSPPLSLSLYAVTPQAAKVRVEQVAHTLKLNSQRASAQLAVEHARKATEDAVSRALARQVRQAPLAAVVSAASQEAVHTHEP
eukprot:6188172-Pleurochrysis_carterae.AAC.1